MIFNHIIITGDDNNMFHERLRELRISRKLTQKELAERLGLTNTSTISKYETGEVKPSVEIIDKVADLFGVTADYLMGRSHEKSVKDETEELLEMLRTNPDYKILFDLYNEATPAEIKQLIAIHNAMKATNPGLI